MSSSMATEGSALNCPLYLSSESKLQSAGINIALACNLFLDFVFRTQGAVCEETRGHFAAELPLSATYRPLRDMRVLICSFWLASLWKKSTQFFLQ